jgi:hypothetical protein
MGEIKSTLDIIMEKTKGLSMSAEEKAAFQKEETEGRVRGLLQKYIDGVFDPDRLKAELEGLGKTRQTMAMAFVRTACLERIEPGFDSSRLLDLLQDLAGLDPTPIYNVLSKYDDEVLRNRKKRSKELLKRLKKSGISGSAVIPHIEADAEWEKYMLEAKEEFQARLRELA